MYKEQCLASCVRLRWDLDWMKPTAINERRHNCEVCPDQLNIVQCYLQMQILHWIFTFTSG